MMIKFEKALETVLNSARLLAAERVGLAEAAGRILAEDVTSDTDIPPFNKSAMDGFACRRADLADELTLIETIPAGHVPTKTIAPGQCAKIMTGGAVPDGSDCVIMKEYVTAPTENTVRFVGEKTADNICPKGEDINAGEIVVRKGALLKPQHIAILASVGYSEPLVGKRPRVGVIATGNELVEPAATPGDCQIRNSNSFQLAAHVESCGASATNYGIAEDTDNAIDSMFKKAAAENDVVIVSGGVSVGDFDLVPGILKQNNVDLLFEKIAVKPGKPTVFGISDKLYCFGLPGNPVSTFVLFEILVKPFLYKLMDHNYRPSHIQIPLARSVKRKKTERPGWIPVTIIDDGQATDVPYHGSGHINSFCQADALLCIPEGIAEIKEGTTVVVRQI